MFNPHAICLLVGDAGLLCAGPVIGDLAPRRGTTSIGLRGPVMNEIHGHGVAREPRVVVPFHYKFTTDREGASC